MLRKPTLIDIKLSFNVLMVSLASMVFITACRQAEPLIGPAKSGESPGRASYEATDCERIQGLKGQFTVKPAAGRTARYKGDISGYGYSSEYMEEYVDCVDSNCTNILYTKNSEGKWVKTETNAVADISKKNNLEMCEALGTKLLASSMSERSIKVPAGTFKSQCLRTTIAMSFGVKDSQPYSADKGSANSMETVTETESCVSLEEASLGILVQLAQRATGKYTAKDPTKSTDPVELTPSVQLIEIVK